MLIEFDETKQQRTLTERGLDFADANQIFDGVHITGIDDEKIMAKLVILQWVMSMPVWLLLCGRTDLMKFFLLTAVLFL